MYSFLSNKILKYTYKSWYLWKILVKTERDTGWKYVLWHCNKLFETMPQRMHLIKTKGDPKKMCLWALYLEFRFFGVRKRTIKFKSLAYTTTTKGVNFFLKSYQDNWFPTAFLFWPHHPAKAYSAFRVPTCSRQYYTIVHIEIY